MNHLGVKYQKQADGLHGQRGNREVATYFAVDGMWMVASSAAMTVNEVARADRVENWIMDS